MFQKLRDWRVHFARIQKLNRYILHHKFLKKLFQKNILICKSIFNRFAHLNISNFLSNLNRVMANLMINPPVYAVDLKKIQLKEIHIQRR